MELWCYRILSTELLSEQAELSLVFLSFRSIDEGLSADESEVRRCEVICCPRGVVSESL